MVVHQEMWIAGHPVGGECDQATPKVVVRNPFNGSVAGTAAEGDYYSLTTAIESAHDAYPSWSSTTAERRQAILKDIAAEVRVRKQELAQVLVDEIGKPITAALGEVERLAVTFDLSAAALDQWNPVPESLSYDSRGNDFECSISRFPLGVVFAIVPYNWPYNLTAHKVAPALACGNTVVVKPSPLAILSTYHIIRLANECGLPPGVLNCVSAEVPDVQKALKDSRIKVVSFTGSVPIGWSIKQDALPTQKVILELGGDASAIIDQDADIESALPKVVTGAFAYAGQICISLQHLWVHESIYDEVKFKLIDLVKACKAGDPNDPTVVCGPMISKEAADRVESWVTEAVGKGGKILVHGVRDRNILSPVLIENVPSDSKLQNEEVFGPVLTLRSFATIEEVVGTLNNGKYGIQAGLFTKDYDNVELVYRTLNIGGLVVDDVPTVRFDSFPYGGVKQSGVGREGVGESMLEYSQPKTLLRRTNG